MRFFWGLLALALASGLDVKLHVDINTAAGEQQPQLTSFAERTLSLRWRFDCRDGDDQVNCRSVQQRGYRIQIFRRDWTASSVENVFDSGILSGSETITSLIPKELESDARYTVRVASLWADPTSVNLAGETAAEASFQTAMLEKGDWDDVQWIGGFSQLRADFKVRSTSGGVSYATAYVSGYVHLAFGVSKCVRE
jgi:hypothetical protein